MPTKLKKEELLAVENLPDAVKADLTALFADIDERDTTITELRKKHQDADEIVKNAPVLEALAKTQAAKIDLLNTELAKYTGKPAEADTDLYGIFAPFFRD